MNFKIFLAIRIKKNTFAVQKIHNNGRYRIHTPAVKHKC